MTYETYELEKSSGLHFMKNKRGESFVIITGEAFENVELRKAIKGKKEP